MLNTYIKKRHLKGFYYALIDLNIAEIFKRTVWIDRDRFGRLYDYGVYLYVDTSKDDWIYLKGMKFPIKGQLIYIGRGVYDPNNPLDSRCLNHPESDELSKHLNENICAFLMGWGMSYVESAALEAFWIKECGLSLLKRNENWNGTGLINKRRERRSEEIAKQILKIWK